MAHVLGLDIRKTVVRATLAKVTARAVEVLRYLEAPLLPSSSTEGARAAVHDALQNILLDARPAPDRIVTALPGTSASFRTMKLPAATVRRAHEVLPFELESVLPYDVETAIVEYQVIASQRAEAELLVVAVPRSHVGEHVALLADSNLSPKEVAVGAAALDGLLPIAPVLGTGGVVLLDVGTDRTEFAAFLGGACVLARTLSVTMDDARGGRLETTLRQTLTALKATAGGQVDRMVLTGEAASDEYAAGWLAERLGIEVQTLSLPDAPGADPRTHGRFAYATALACRGALRKKRIDVRRGEFAEVTTSNDLRKHAKLFAISATCILLAFAFSITARRSGLESENQALAEELATVTERAFGKTVRDPQEARAMLEGRGGEADPLPKFDAYDALESISDRLPPDIQHEVRKLVVELDDDGQGGRFELRGQVASIAERDRIAAALAEHECFHDVQKGTTTPAPGGAGIAYPIEATIRCPGAVRAKDTKKGRGRSGS